MLMIWWRRLRKWKRWRQPSDAKSCQLKKSICERERLVLPSFYNLCLSFILSDFVPIEALAAIKYLILSHHPDSTITFDPKVITSVSLLTKYLKVFLWHIQDIITDEWQHGSLSSLWICKDSKYLEEMWCPGTC